MLMKKISFIFIMCFGALFAQNNDSLENLLKTNIPDTVKLQILTDLSWNSLYSDLDKSMKFAEQELQLAQKINNQKYIGQGYNDIGIVHIKRNNYPEAIKWHKKALDIRLKLKNEMD